MGRYAALVVALAVAAAAIHGAAASSGTDAPASVASDLIEATVHCHQAYAATGPLTGSVEIDVAVGADGRAKAVTTPPGAGDRMAAAAQCVGVRLAYRAALQDGLPVPGRLVMTVEFPTLPEVRGDLRRVVDYCHAPWTDADVRLGTTVRNAAGFPVRNRRADEMDARVASARSNALEGSVNLVARVGKDGRIKEYQLPGGTLEWMREAVKCVADRLEFYPARLRTELLESWTLLPLSFGLSDVQHLEAEIEPPRPRSDEASILAAYRKCYPAGQTAMVTIHYRITVAKTGRVRNAELLESSGNAALDEAGACILRNLVFFPARRNVRDVESTLNWPILVRPPD
ncbi:MAG TPA: TonB family protein [Steroidobacteraceae bacterium]|nr:TonB family protein [Steroidobacteraceae bacterium]